MIIRKLFYALVVLLFTWDFSTLQVNANLYEVVIASNNANHNELLVYNTKGKLVKALSTEGRGGVPSHIIGGGVAKTNGLVAVINYSSQTVALFKLQRGAYTLVQLIPTISQPVSVVFGNQHLYILGTTTIESHALHGDGIDINPDGSSALLIGDGSAAQVGFLLNQLIITERSNMVELVELINGAVTNKINSVLLPPPPGNNTPLGLTTRCNSAYVAIAQSDTLCLVHENTLVATASSESQHIPCWLTHAGPWLFCSNAQSKSISRYSISENSLTLNELIAAYTEGQPTDIDAGEGILAVIETRNKNNSYLSQFQMDENGELELINSMPIPSTANGVAIIKVHKQLRRKQ